MSASFDAYVIYLYVVMGLPAKEIAEHQGVSKDEVSGILRRYGFNYKNTYGAGQHFKAYPKGKSFKLKNGKTIELEITQGFVESYVKSGNFYDNAFEDFINRYFTPEDKPKRAAKPKPEPTEQRREPETQSPEQEQPDSPEQQQPNSPGEPEPQSPEEEQRDRCDRCDRSEQSEPRKEKPHREIKIPPKVMLFLKILGCVIAAGLLVLAASCAGCVKFDEISCEGIPPVFQGDETSVFDLQFSVMDGAELPDVFSVLVDGVEQGTISLSEPETLLFRLKGLDGRHTIEVSANGEKSNPLSADTDSDSIMYIVISNESGVLHISQTSE